MKDKIKKNTKRLTTEEVIGRCKEVHGDKYDYSLVEWVNSTTKIAIICREHGVFYQLFSNHLKDHGCPFCGKAHNKKRVNEIFFSNCERMFGDGYTDIVYDSHRKKVSFYCALHGMMENQNSVRFLDFGCEKCYKNRRFVESAMERHGDKFDYSQSVYIDHKTPLLIICRDCGHKRKLKPIYHIQTGNGHSPGFCEKCVKIEKKEKLKKERELARERKRELREKEKELREKLKREKELAREECRINKPTRMAKKLFRKVNKIYGDNFHFHNYKDYKHKVDVICNKCGCNFSRCISYAKEGLVKCPDCKKRETEFRNLYKKKHKSRSKTNKTRQVKKTVEKNIELETTTYDNIIFATKNGFKIICKNCNETNIVKKSKGCSCRKCNSKLNDTDNFAIKVEVA